MVTGSTRGVARGTGGVVVASRAAVASERFRLDFIPAFDLEGLRAGNCWERMRLGLLGPADGNVDGLARATETLVERAGVDRAIYLGTDDTLDEVVAMLATRIVESDPTDDAAWRRAVDVAVRGTPREIDAFVARERARQRLRILEGLPKGGIARTIEMIGDRVAVLVYDKGLLDEEDIFAASLLVYGKSPEPLVKRIGARWFMTPGNIGVPGGGAAVLDDDGEEIVASVYAADGTCTMKETIAIQRTTKMKIQGGA